MPQTADEIINQLFIGSSEQLVTGPLADFWTALLALVSILLIVFGSSLIIKLLRQSNIGDVERNRGVGGYGDDEEENQND